MSNPTAEGSCIWNVNVAKAFVLFCFFLMHSVFYHAKLFVHSFVSYLALYFLTELIPYLTLMRQVVLQHPNSCIIEASIRVLPKCWSHSEEVRWNMYLLLIASLLSRLVFVSCSDQHRHFLCPVGRSQGTHLISQNLKGKPIKIGGYLGIVSNILFYRG